MKKACTIGSATSDIFLLYQGTDVLDIHQKENVRSYMLLEKGVKVDIPKIQVGPGGGATNVAVGLSRLGISVTPFFKTGDDEAGKMIRSTLEQENITTQFCPLDTQYDTAFTIIIPSLEKDHAALCYRSANLYQSMQQFPLSLLKELDLLFIGPLSGASKEMLQPLVDAAYNEGVPIACNPGLSQLTEKTVPFIEALKKIDTVIVNTRESGFLMQRLLEEPESPLFVTSSSAPHLLQEYVHFGSRYFTINEVARTILDHGPQTLVITNGSEGVYVITKEKIYFHPSIPSSPVSSLGAGDAFSSAFLGARLQERSIQEALRYGVMNATSVLSYPDAQKGLLRSSTLQEQSQKISLSVVMEFPL